MLQGEIIKMDKEINSNKKIDKLSKTKKLIHFLNEGESYLAASIFIFMTIFLFLQAFTRYVLKYSITWTEELTLLIYVPMVYMCIAAAVYNRKHIRIDALLTIVPFKTKKFILILSNIIYLIFCFILIYFFGPIIKGVGSSVSQILHIPQAPFYISIPVLHVLIGIRLIQDTIRLWHEKEADLGVSIPIVDLDACEREYRDILLKKKL